MTKTRWLAAASALSILTLAACQQGQAPANGTAGSEATAGETADGLSQLARIEMNPDASYLSAEEKEVVNLLIQAAGYMSEIC